MSADLIASHQSTLTRFRGSSTLIGRFVLRRNLRSAVLWAAAFGVLVAAKAAGYVTAYPTARGRLQLQNSFGNNVGLKALLGVPRGLATVSGFTVWNTLGVMVIVGSVWGFLLATRTFRGEEDAGRWELMLSGPTTARRAAVNALAGLGSCLIIFYIIAASAFTEVGKLHGVGYSPSAGLFFALAAVSAIAMFMAVGAFTSQLMPIRSRAASTAAVIFGVSFLLRAMGDITSASWLTDISPLGWIEKLQPLYHSQPIWLLPIFTLVAGLSALTVWLAGRRDLGDSTFADKDSARPRTGLLNRPLTMGFRLTRTATISWLLAITFVAAFFGGLTKSATQVFNGSQQAQKFISHLTHASRAAQANDFLGIVFFFVIMLMMAYAASAVSAVREDEAEGYLDNLLVRPVGRWQWLAGRVGLGTLTLITTAGLTILAVWAGTKSGQIDVPFHLLIQAGLNSLPPALLTLGIAVCAFGLVPRLTSLIAYGVLAWSFLLQIVSSGINLNHWLLDTSVLHQVALAPASPPVWRTDLIMVGLGVTLVVIGALAFNRRDLQTE